MAYGSYVPQMDWSPLSELGKTITTNLQAGQKQQLLSQLGQQMQSGDLAGATKTALASGDLHTAMSLFQLGQEQEAGKTAQGIAGGQPQPQGDYSLTPMSGGASAPRGLRNFNPGNIEDGGFAKSQQGYLGNDGRFARFDTIDNGVRAQSNLLASYGQKGVNTVSGIVNRWAPSAENGATTGNYAAFVTKLRYLLTDLKRSDSFFGLWRGVPTDAIIATLDLHLNRAEPALSTPIVPSWRARLARLAMAGARVFVGLAERLMPELRRI